MGLFDSIKERLLGRGDINVGLIKHYGKKAVSNDLQELNRLSKLPFRETIGVSDQILEKYKDKTGQDIQRELMKKYLKTDVLALDEQMQRAEIREELKDQNLSEEEKEKVVEETLEKRRNAKDKEFGNDKDKARKASIYEALYNVQLKDYTELAAKAKKAQFDKNAVTLSAQEAMTLVAMEKNLEKTGLLYHNNTKKNIEDVDRIKKKREDFEHKMDYNQRGTEMRGKEQALEIDRLYADRAKKYKEYIQAIKDPNKSPQEKYAYKRAYEEANLALFQKVPSIQEFTQELQVQKGNEELAKKELKGDHSIVAGQFREDIKTTDSKMAQVMNEVQEDKIKEDEMAFEQGRKVQEEELEKGNISAAKAIGDAQSEGMTYDENIDKTPEQATKVEAKQEVKENFEDRENTFQAGLRRINNLETKSPDELRNIVEDRKKDEEEKIREDASKQAQEVEDYNEKIRMKKNNKPNV